MRGETSQTRGRVISCLRLVKTMTYLKGILPFCWQFLPLQDVPSTLHLLQHASAVAITSHNYEGGLRIKNKIV